MHPKEFITIEDNESTNKENNLPYIKIKIEDFNLIALVANFNDKGKYSRKKSNNV